MHENGILGTDLFSVMDKMSKFRNIVVHRYEDVDAEIIIIILKRHMNDFALFVQTILDYLKTSD